MSNYVHNKNYIKRKRKKPATAEEHGSRKSRIHRPTGQPNEAKDTKEQNKRKIKQRKRAAHKIGDYTYRFWLVCAHRLRAFRSLLPFCSRVQCVHFMCVSILLTGDD